MFWSILMEIMKMIVQDICGNIMIIVYIVGIFIRGVYMKFIKYLKFRDKTINFSKCKISGKMYHQSSTQKIGIMYKQEKYLLKVIDKKKFKRVVG